jgi:hypothetical protein
MAVLMTVVLATSPVEAQGDKTPTIKEIMGKLHKGTTSLRPALGKELKAEEPNWEEVQKQTKEFALLAASIGKNDPPMGEKASWEKLTKAYADTAKAMDAAAQKKDKKAALAAHGKLSGACLACHKAHRPS